MKRLFNILLALLCFLPILLSAQSGSISGKVIDAKLAEGLIGASVRLDDGASLCVYADEVQPLQLPVGG